MSISRFNAKIGKKGNATPHHAYICGINQYEKKQGVMLTQSGNMPSWAVADPATFWQTADERERANGTTYKEHTLSLPRELSLEQQKIVVDRWVEQELGDKHPYTYAIHHARAKDGGLNPHAHLMFSKRTMDGIERTPEQFFKRANKKDPSKGGAVKADTGMTRTDMRQELTAQRERWGEHLRQCLQEFGLDEIAKTVDMRAWHERGLAEPPKNISMKELQMAKKLDSILENHPYHDIVEPWRQHSFLDEPPSDNSFAIDKIIEPPTPAPTPPPRTSQRSNSSYDYDFGM